MSILLYGATGYTGKLIARMARQTGVSVTLAGRNAAKLQSLAAETGFDHTAIDLGDDAGLADLVGRHDVVLHIAGPFSRTARPMVEACLAQGKHYLDITGEIAVFEAHRALDARAREAGVMLMSGVGFDIVPSDCLALHLKQRMPAATRLTLAMQGMGQMSHGTGKTAIEAIDRGTAVRRGGEITFLSATPRRTFRFGNRQVDCVGVSWGDVATAWYTAGIPDIAVYFEATKGLEQLVGLPGLVRWLLATPPGQAFLRRQIDKLPEGPDPEAQKTQTTQILGIVEDADGNEMRALLTTPGGYHLTALTALRIAREVDGGRFAPGTHNPAEVFGADFITTFEGCALTDPA